MDRFRYEIHVLMFMYWIIRSACFVGPIALHVVFNFIITALQQAVCQRIRMREKIAMTPHTAPFLDDGQSNLPVHEKDEARPNKHYKG